MLVEVRPGEGGDDAVRFADECFGALVAHGNRVGSVSDVARTPRISTCEISGAPRIADLAGTHRVQRIPTGAAARHTSTATVAVLEREAAGPG